MPYRHVVSYAFSRSKNTVTACCFLMKALRRKVSNLTRWSRVDRPRLKPHWYSITETGTISETWLNHSSSLVNLRNYNFIRHDRQTLNVNNQIKHGGGLGIYIHDTIDYDPDTISHYNVSNRDIEAQWVVIKRNHCKKIILCNVYRPPEGNVDIALETLTNSLSNMPDLDKSDLVLLGDFNVAVSKQNDPGTKNTSL